VENYVDDETIQKILEESLDKLPSKKKFLLQELFGLDWRDLTNGQRQRLGKYFYRAVINGQYPNVKFIGKKSAYGGKAMYEKI
jgi:hypothetical protein